MPPKSKKSPKNITSTKAKKPPLTITARLTAEQRRQLREAADANNTSETALIQVLIDQYLPKLGFGKRLDDVEGRIDRLEFAAGLGVPTKGASGSLAETAKSPDNLDKIVALNPPTPFARLLKFEPNLTELLIQHDGDAFISQAVLDSRESVTGQGETLEIAFKNLVDGVEQHYKLDEPKSPQLPDDSERSDNASGPQNG